MGLMLLVDNNVLSSLAKTDRLFLLQKLANSIFTTTSVIAELNKASSLGFDFVEKINKIMDYRGGWLKIISPTIQEIRDAERILCKSLSFTDAECIAIAKNRHLIILTDDRHVTTKALQEKVRVWDLKIFLAACIKKQIIGSKEELIELLFLLKDKDNYRFSTKDEKFLLELVKRQ